MPETPATCIQGPVHFWDSSTCAWTQQASPAQPSETAACLPPSDTADLTVVIINTDQIKEHGPCQSAFLTEVGLPEYWWDDYYKNLSAYFAFESHRDDDGRLVSTTSWARLMTKLVTPPKNTNESVKVYRWYKINVAVRWTAATGQTAVYMFDPPAELQPRLPDMLVGGGGGGVPQARARRHHMRDPFWVYPPLLEKLGEMQERAVWMVRTMVRERELNRMTQLEREQNRMNGPAREENRMAELELSSAYYMLMHDASRHVTHVGETLATSVATCRAMLEQQALVKQMEVDEGEGSGNDDRERVSKERRLRLAAYEATRQRILAVDMQLTGLKDRSASNEARMASEVQLVFNQVADYDAKLSLEIGKDTRVDSAAMRTVSFVTLFFLPATFIATIFGTNFFDYDGEKGTLSVADEFWVYWVASGAMTAITFAVWLWWRFLPMSKRADLYAYDGS